MVALILILGACGVRTQDSAVRIDRDQIPRALRPTSTDRDESPGQFGVYLIRSGQLVRVARSRAGPVSPTDALLALEAGPTTTESDAGLSTALGPDAVESVRTTGPTAVVRLGGGLIAGPGVTGLAFGQMVLTLTSLGSVDKVRFLVDGIRVPVPRADGTRSRSAMSSADYESLVAP